MNHQMNQLAAVRRCEDLALCCNEVDGVQATVEAAQLECVVARPGRLQLDPSATLSWTI
jgi:hypothetical protein